MEENERKVRNQIAIAVLTALLAGTILYARKYISQCNYIISRDARWANCADLFVENAGPLQKLVYNSSIVIGIFLALLALYLFAKIETNPRAQEIIAERSFKAANLSRKWKILSWVIAVVVVLAIMIIGHYYVKPPDFTQYK